MYKFTYPADKWDEQNVNKNIILRLITKHVAIADNMQLCKQYYDGKQAILERTREKNAPNNKTVCNHAKDITDTATGYFMGNPITYSNTGDQDIDPLLTAFDKAEIDDVDFDNAMDTSIEGLAYEYVYAKENESIPVSKNISPMQTFMVYDDSIEENELCGVYYYPKKNDADNALSWVAVVATKNYIYNLVIENNTSIDQATTEEPIPHYFGEVPIIEYLNNKEGQGDFEQQIPLIDAYNKLMSDRVNDKEQFVDAILVLYGSLLGEDEDESTKAYKQLREEKLLELPTDAKAEYLTRQMDESGVEVLRKALKEDIYTFSHVPNLSDQNFVGNASGVAMEYKLLGLEMLTKIKERNYKKGLRKRIRLYCNFLGMKAIALEAGSIIPTFSRSLPKNLQELAGIVYNLKDMVSQRTLLKLLPFVEDPDAEIEDVEEQQDAAVKRQQELFAQGVNNTPDDEVDLDGEDEEDNATKSAEEKKPADGVNTQAEPAPNKKKKA